MATKLSKKDQKKVDSLYEQGKKLGIAINAEYARRGQRFDPATGRAVSVLGTPRIPQTITSADLAPTPTISPVVVAPTTQSAGMMESISTINDENLKKADEFAKAVLPTNNTLKTETDNARLTLKERLLGRKTETGLQNEKYAQEVDPSRRQLDDINQQIRERSLSYRRRIENVQDKGIGGLVGGTNAEVDRLNQKGARELADLSITQQALQGKYDSAKDIADRAIQAELEQESNEIEGLKFWYEENKEQLNDEEDKRFTLMVNERERLLNTEEATKKTISDLAIQAGGFGAPASTVQKALRAKTLDEAVGYLGSYLQDPEKINRLNDLNIDLTGSGLPGVTNTNASAYSNALQVILGSEKFTKDQKKAVVNAINNGQDPFAVIKNQAKNIMGQTLATGLDKYETAASQLNSINNALSDYYANGGKTNIFNGNYEKVLNSLGTLSDPKLVEIATQISAALQIYRNAVSGTAYSVQEGRDIASIFPGINKTEGLNRAVIDGRLTAFNDTIDQSYRNTLGSSYDELKSTQKISETDAKAKVINAGKTNPQIKQTIIQMKQGDPNLTYEEIAQILNL